MRTTVYIIRHAEAEGNVYRRLLTDRFNPARPVTMFSDRIVG